jgi:diguanylate cyclase (GGDEF)-like protein
MFQTVFILVHILLIHAWEEMHGGHMAVKTVINDISKYLKRMILVNMLVLTLIIPFILLGIGVETSYIAIITALGGFLLCAANFFFINNYFVRKTETTLSLSYASLQNDYLHDELTKVYNRRAGLIRLNEEFSRAKRHGSTLSVAMVDADHFKNINDTYGHIVGDKVLTHIASTLKSGLRECDVVIRYGGEEFLILLPDTTGNQASLPLNRLRQRLAESAFLHNTSIIKISISIGIATVSQIDVDSMDTVLRADKALYSAKRSGRNKVVYDRPKTGLYPVMTHA